MPYPEQYANAASSPLSGAITSGAISMAVASGTIYSQVPQFRVQVESEYILVTGVTGNVMAVVRGVEGSTPAAHANGVLVTQIVTASGLAGICGQTVLDGPYTSLPPAGTVGRLFLVSGGVSLVRDNGSGWDTWGRLSSLIPPPASGSLTPLNVATAALSGIAGTLFINAPNIGVAHGQFWMKSLASGAYTWIAHLESLLFNVTDSQCGLALRDSSGGKLITFEHQASSVSTSTVQLRVIQWTDMNTRTGSALDLFIAGSPFPWLKITDDGASNRTYSVSRDGINWLDVLTESRTTWLGVAPNQAGIFATANGAAVGLGVYSWSGV